MKIPITEQGKVVFRQEPDVEVSLHTKIRVPMSFLTGQEFDDEDRPSTEEGLWEAIQVNHVYGPDPIQNFLGILSECGMFHPPAVQELEINIVEREHYE